MKWRTCEEEPCKEQDCLIMLKNLGICVVGTYYDDTWYEEYTHSKDDVKKWCPLDEIIEALDKGDSSDAK